MTNASPSHFSFDQILRLKTALPWSPPSCILSSPSTKLLPHLGTPLILRCLLSDDMSKGISRVNMRLGVEPPIVCIGHGLVENFLQTPNRSWSLSGKSMHLALHPSLR